MTVRMRVALLGTAFLLLAAVAVRNKGAAGLPNRDQVIQWWTHRGAEVSAGSAQRPLVLLISGQSNAGNYGRGSRRRAQSGVYNVYRGRLYRAQDPLLGSDGLGISPWIAFSQEVLKRGSAQSVVLALAVRGGAGVRAWGENGPMRSELFERLQDLRRLGLTPDYVLWQQGESDAPPYQTNPNDYSKAVRSVIASLRSSGVSAPVFIALATRNASHPFSQPLREAQLSLVDPAGRIERGPDVDTLGPEFRYDGVHFSESGVAALSQLWLDAVASHI